MTLKKFLIHDKKWCYYNNKLLAKLSQIASQIAPQPPQPVQTMKVCVS